MTLPDERYRSIKHCAEFMQQLASGEITDVKKIREDARWVLRHFPTVWDLDRMAERAPDLLAREMEPLHRWVLAAKSDDTVTTSKDSLDSSLD